MSQYNYKLLGPLIKEKAGPLLQAGMSDPKIKYGIIGVSAIIGIILVVVIFGKFKDRWEASDNKLIGVIYYTAFLGSLFTALYGLVIATPSILPVFQTIWEEHKWVVVWAVFFLVATIIGQVFWSSLADRYEVEANESRERYEMNRKETINSANNYIEHYQNEIEGMKRENMFLQ